MPRHTSRHPRPSSRRQRGVSALEFALSFSFLFALFWAVISYSLPLFLLHAMQNAVNQGARVAESVDVGSTTYSTDVKALVAFELDRQTRWLPAAWVSRISPLPSATSNVTISGTTLVISLTVPNYAANPLVPALVLPGVGRVPNLPVALTATARLTP